MKLPASHAAVPSSASLPSDARTAESTASGHLVRSTATTLGPLVRSTRLLTAAGRSAYGIHTVHPALAFESPQNLHAAPEPAGFSPKHIVLKREL